jgi:hypothetical protein
MFKRLFLFALFCTAPAQLNADATCSVSIEGKQFDLHRSVSTPQDLIEVWDFLQRTRIGKPAATAFSALRGTTQEWKVGFLGARDWHQYQVPEHTAALCLPHEMPIRIHLKANSNFAVLAIYLVHEATHAMDEALRDSYKHNLHLQQQATETQAGILARIARREGVRIEDLQLEHYTDAELRALRKAVDGVTQHTNASVFASERKAYDLQYEFIEEVAKLATCARPYLESMAERRAILIHRPTDREIRATYDL